VSIFFRKMPNPLLIFLVAVLWFMFTAAESEHIPRKWHQVFIVHGGLAQCNRSDLVEVAKDKWVPSLLGDIILKQKKDNPKWHYTMWDITDIALFLQKHRQFFNNLLEFGPGEDIAEIYESINPAYGAARADFIRNLIIYIHGGMYLDTKSLSLVPFDDLYLPSDRFVAVSWDQKIFGGWGRWGDDIPGRGEEYPNWFFAAMPHSPIVKTIIQRLVHYSRHYLSNCMEWQRCKAPSKYVMAYKYKGDSQMNRSEGIWPRRTEHCFGHKGTITMTGPIVFTSAIMAAVNNATTAEAKEALGFRAFAADSEKNLVVNPWYCKDRTSVPKERLHCGQPGYDKRSEPIYLPHWLSSAITEAGPRAHHSIPPGPAGCY
jgi:hypothetical protein